LQREIERSDGRRSHKRRYGYHEKPSELRRKKAKFCRRQIQAGGGLGLSIHPHRALWARSGPTNALMR
jgi:hypothetical protein